MQLSPDEIKLFLKLHSSFLFFVNKKLQIEKLESIDDFLALPFHQKNNIRNAARKNMKLLDSFIKENPFNFNDVDLAIVSSWRYAIDSSFYLLKYDEEYAVFLDTGTTPRAFGVCCLKKTFSELLGDSLPAYVKTVLLPFKNKIVYDGFIFTYSITFDSPIVQELEADYENWVSRHNLIVQLPDISDSKDTNNVDLLKYYMRSQRNREVYAREIPELLNQNPNLNKLYCELAGRLDAREARVFFREIGIRDVWCAVLHGKILATGSSKEMIIDILASILPRDQKLYPFIFHYKETT